MSAATVERDLVLDPVSYRSLQPGRTVPSPVRPGRRSGRSAAPTSRPGGAAQAPSLRQLRTRSRSCEIVRARTEPTTWRLTDRGIAAVLIVGAMIMVAALSVIGLTAARVTSERFAPVTLSAAQS